MRTKAIGYGMGKKDFEQANCVRAFLGESERQREQITKLECNLDDMTGEDIGFATEQLFQAGAKEVFTQAVGMKKQTRHIADGALSDRRCRQTGRRNDETHFDPWHPPAGNEQICSAAIRGNSQHFVR